MDQKSPLTPSLPTTSQIQPLIMNLSTPAVGYVKTGTPDRLTVPKAFKYLEMYKSPTDQIMSPVSKGLLARTRFTKSYAPLPVSLSTRNSHQKI
ncbi:hypothetical protein R6Q57_005442 [Mikania cordata]